MRSISYGQSKSTGSAGLGPVIPGQLTSQHISVVAINYANNDACPEEALKSIPRGCVAIRWDVTKRNECLNLVKGLIRNRVVLTCLCRKLGGVDLPPFNDIG